MALDPSFPSMPPSVANLACQLLEEGIEMTKKVCREIIEAWFFFHFPLLYNILFYFFKTEELNHMMSLEIIYRVSCSRPFTLASRQGIACRWLKVNAK